MRITLIILLILFEIPNIIIVFSTLDAQYDGIYVKYFEILIALAIPSKK